MRAYRECTIRAGSPPQVRGKPTLTCEGVRVAGITPAGAGKTISPCLFRPSARDHPRRCGENAASTSRKRNAAGSPPQVRGKHKQKHDPRGRLRITPAGAGKTVSRYIDSAVRQDHPRRCGENDENGERTPCGTGSPPQVRGKLMPSLNQLSDKGITPAGAGKTAHKHKKGKCE